MCWQLTHTHGPCDPRQSNEDNPAKHRKLLALPARPGYGTDVGLTRRWGSTLKVNDRSRANNGSHEQTCSFIRSALMSYIRRTEGLFVLPLTHHIERFNDLWKAFRRMETRFEKCFCGCLSELKFLTLSQCGSLITLNEAAENVDPGQRVGIR